VFLKGALGTLGNLVLMVFVLFFVLRDGPELGRRVVRLLPIEPGRRARLRQHLVEVTLAVFVGVFGGLHAFGFIGLFVGPIVLGVVVALLRYESEQLEAARAG